MSDHSRVAMDRAVELAPPPSSDDKEAFSAIFTEGAVHFIKRLVQKFDGDVDAMLRERKEKKLLLDSTGGLPSFADSSDRRNSSWQIAPLPPRLANRHLDLGDVSPAWTDRFIRCLKSNVQGIQTDFDDGHCPTWHNQLTGWYNIYLAARGRVQGVPDMGRAPVLMLRPRAWNMVEHNIMVDGKQTPGPLVDFGLLMYHNARLLMEAGSGPFFYLSKLEGSREARLWNQVFVWVQSELGLKQGTVKACVLIENVFATFEMEEILYELREHSLGLNCGVWDYSASFINKFGGRKEFLLPDRSKYVNMTRPFLKSYMQLVVRTCHKRGAPATGGMAAVVLPEETEKREMTIKKVLDGKRVEIEAGVDGFLVYDLGLVEPLQELWRQCGHVRATPGNESTTPSQLLSLPAGGVTLEGLRNNVSIGILFISAWLAGHGVFVYKGNVEDSATAEISRSQVWQWIRHGARLEESGDVVTLAMVADIVNKFVNGNPGEDIGTAAQLFLEIVAMREFPEFITSLLSDNHVFLARHK